ncbi:unnamed protein product [Parascedosporium putredinis]|uniref:Transcription factor domain-containing protein n=1 Tax=Parascedosporium putredinis TaxID=1442378 RepID=A0A9P1H3C6_9PEZI|nr:unnamed protein product [Parascedosporium putredinis]CAI7996867.1 unnamed protein product [Parascedosporium putredinis]
MNAPSPSTTTAASKSSAERLSPNMDVERTPIPDQDRDRNGDSQYSNTNKENHHDGRNTHDDTPTHHLRTPALLSASAYASPAINVASARSAATPRRPSAAIAGFATRRISTRARGSRVCHHTGDHTLGSRDWRRIERSDLRCAGSPSGSVTSTSVSAATESPISHGIVDASPASGDGSVAAGTLSWVARGYQHSTIGGGGESSVTDSNADVVVNTDNSSHRFKYMGGSSLQCLGMFVDIYLRRKGLATMAPTSATLYRLDNNCPNGLRQGLSSGHVPQLVAIYALVVLGADEMAGELTAVGETYLEAAYSLLAHLTAAPYLPSVQALFLLSGVTQGDDSSEMPELGLKGRIWWSCYALEKLMELETGRPSAIDDDDIDQISKRLYRHRPNSAWRLMYEIGTLDQKLLEWAKTVPEGMKPGHELFTDLDSDQPQYPQHITSFLSLQYYQAQITLLRPSLVFPTQSFTDEVKRQGSKIPSYMRLLQAENICNASARATVRLVIELDDHGIRSNISSVSQPSLAAVVLSLSILKSPNKRLIRSDLELLTILTEYIETYFRRGGQDPAFIRGFEVLRTGVIAAVELERTGVTKAVGDMDMGLLDTQLTGPIPVTWETSSAVPEITADSSMFSFGEDMPLDELWGTFGTYSFLDPSVEEQVV